MKVKVQLFATLSLYLPRGVENRTATLDLPEGASVAEAFRVLRLPDDLPKLILLNGINVKEDARLKEGDVLSVFPPIAGG
ncbi:MAG: MoaD/ThiS family protein [candidate division NC10 bacterium]|nr:MoaD/ThiS family protein [candidate division NC10 bacterium]